MHIVYLYIHWGQKHFLYSHLGMCKYSFLQYSCSRHSMGRFVSCTHRYLNRHNNTIVALLSIDNYEYIY